MLDFGFSSIKKRDILNQTARGLFLKIPCPQVSYQRLTLDLRNKRRITWITQPHSCVHTEIIHLSKISSVNSSKDKPTQGELQKQLFLKFCRVYRNTVGLPALQRENKSTPTPSPPLLLSPSRPFFADPGGSRWQLYPFNHLM